MQVKMSAVGESDMDCIFCKIVRGEIPANRVLETDLALAFDDNSPAAPVHTLVIPKKHIANVAELQPDDQLLAGHLLLCASEVARKKGIHDSGFRIISNSRNNGGQEVYHLHVHVIGGRSLGRKLLS